MIGGVGVSIDSGVCEVDTMVIMFDDDNDGFMIHAIHGSIINKNTKHS